MLAEAAHSGLDLVAAIVTFLAVRVSDRPADEHHPYGHGKVENFSALIETLLLVITCVWIVYESIQRLFFHATQVDPSIWAFVVMGLSIVINISRSRMLYRTARKHGSQALEADALHFSTDVWSSWVVVGGLALVWLGQNVDPAHEELFNKADAVAALGVAVIVAFVTYDLGKRTVEVLLDSAPAGIQSQIAAGRCRNGGRPQRRAGARPPLRRSALRRHERRCGPQPPGSTALTSLPRPSKRRCAAWPRAPTWWSTPIHERTTARTWPSAPAPSPPTTMPPSTTSASTIPTASLLVDLHLEVDDHLSLRQAHEMSQHIERDLRAENRAIAHVNSHIESRGTGVGNGQEVTAVTSPNS